ncbi:MAG: hypothetical protein JO296_13505 [Pseudonocardiales bacterium]|nr:hypothetical protein [Pseudonocardiales bacterium]MBV9651137.1 hypothetical protein [Pseudonocardiales bacterium]
MTAGELVRVLDLAEQPMPRELRCAPGDWSLIDGQQIIKMHYQSDGQFHGAQLLGPSCVELHRTAADAA